MSWKNDLIFRKESNEKFVVRNFKLPFERRCAKITGRVVQVIVNKVIIRDSPIQFTLTMEKLLHRTDRFYPINLLYFTPTLRYGTADSYVFLYFSEQT